MKTKIQSKISIAFAALVIAFMALPMGRQAEAQYCGFDLTTTWYNYAIIDDVIVTDITEGTVVLERTGTGYEQWATIDETDGPYEFNIGNDFELEINWGVYYRGYVYAYIDRNDDQRWERNPMGPDEEFLGRDFRTSGFVRPPSITFNTVFDFSLDDDTPEGPSVMRIKANYYNFYSDPCVLYGYVGYRWGYGEVEDYAIKFVAPIPETYPAGGNILFNNQAYDGTTRTFKGAMTDFPLPAVEFKGPQAAGNKIEYWIEGPLPSTNVVYRALEAGTGEQQIVIPGGTTTFQMQSATGDASVSTSEGTFLPTRGGEYKVNVKLIKASGKEAQGVQVFTVANDFDMSVAGITTPRTSRFPRFFKYLRSTNIAVVCDVQNTGLNPVSKFEVYCKIYDADNDSLVSNPPKVVFDATNDPNLNPLVKGQKFEAEFAAFNTPFTGEYYTIFEVSYTFDEEEYNNYLPRPDGDKHYFEVQYNDQLTAGVFVNPTEADTTYRVNKPIAPVVTFFNNGISDASNINFHMVVTNEAGDEVYNDVSFLEDLPQGRYNSRSVTFPNMLITLPGTYTACSWVDYPFDSKHDDDTVCVNFDVELGNSGVITVGDLNEEDNIGSGNTDENQTREVDMSTLRVENQEFNFTGFSPNPATTSTVVRFDGVNTLALEVIDMNGNVVLTAASVNDFYNLDVSGLASGTYTVLLRNENGVQTKQLSVVR